MKPPTLADLDAALERAVACGDWPTAEQVGHQADQLVANLRRGFTCHAAALWYAQQGLRVFPLQPGLKIPLKGSHGCHDATSDPNQINEWWAAHPGANVAIATGHLVDVIDIDGATGVRSWLGARNHPELVGRVSTPRPGGWHLYVQATGAGNASGSLPGIDYRGRGGYVVAPPALLAPSAGFGYSGTYRWTQPLDLSRLQ